MNIKIKELEKRYRLIKNEIDKEAEVYATFAKENGFYPYQWKTDWDYFSIKTKSFMENLHETANRLSKSIEFYKTVKTTHPNFRGSATRSYNQFSYRVRMQDFGHGIGRHFSRPDEDFTAEQIIMMAKAHNKKKLAMRIRIIPLYDSSGSHISVGNTFENQTHILATVLPLFIKDIEKYERIYF